MTTVNSLFYSLFIYLFCASICFVVSSNAKIKENESQLCYSDCDIFNGVSKGFKLYRMWGKQKIMFLRGNN